MKRLYGLMLAILLAFAGLSLGGCNTVAGAGKDVSAGGDAVHDAARDVQKKM